MCPKRVVIKGRDIKEVSVGVVVAHNLETVVLNVGTICISQSTSTLV